MEFGKKIKTARENANFTQTALAKKAGLSKRSIIYYEQDKGNITTDSLKKIANALSLNVDFFLSDNVDKCRQVVDKSVDKCRQVVDKSVDNMSIENKNLPTTNQDISSAYEIELLTLKVSAGRGAHQELVERDGRIQIAKSLFKTMQKQDRLKACVVCGNSMEPRLYDGDMVVFEECGYVGVGIYVLRIGYDFLVKRLEQTLDGRMIVVSLNPSYGAYEVANDVDGAILGRMLLAISKG